jgi:hypothetical protein
LIATVSLKGFGEGLVTGRFEDGWAMAMAPQQELLALATI